MALKVDTIDITDNAFIALTQLKFNHKAGSPKKYLQLNSCIGIALMKVNVHILTRGSATLSYVMLT